eukprot:7831778-Pyramimonas_sp.AAC.1
MDAAAGAAMNAAASAAADAAGSAAGNGDEYDPSKSYPRCVNGTHAGYCVHRSRIRWLPDAEWHTLNYWH